MTPNGHRPRDPAEEDAARHPKVAGCPSYSDDGLHCTRTLGHSGNHIRAEWRRIVAWWPAKVAGP
jgi:hypothetical protein